ncbi:stage III sporulation protein AG [Acetatifactor muris]|uniref:Stage III sporulation protein AG n=1 Tax=Acetatifactor muris TaxID=879566 RepID=A0A2K4ZEH6_9FIRM|nr:stage III sporulation protein AG [Acetatifactor muris]MCR2048472.1 stage III sporulation protein AG [Acetatifactor muris]SOY28858.1 hypothetical protein AMURIS_01572 [Acetatifactor muris]
MKDLDWKKWMEEKGFRKWFRRDNFIILVLAGILLIIIALPVKDGRKSDSDGTARVGGELTADVGMGSGGRETEAAGQETGRTADTDEAYAAHLEERLTELLSQMEGVGKVEVMITLKASRELVVEKEQPVSRSSTHESDSQGGTRIISETDSRENTVYRTEGGASEPYVIKTLSPQIEGVLVVAEGAGIGTVNRTIVETVQALFGVEAHKVKVVRMEADSQTEGK